jgi:hypothetical protein
MTIGWEEVDHLLPAVFAIDGSGEVLADSPSPVAALAQRALRKLDDAGRLDLSRLLEASRPVLLRKEKTLVKAQLAWLDKAGRRDPAGVAATVAVAFGHPAVEVQERALAVVERLARGCRSARPRRRASFPAGCRLVRPLRQAGFPGDRGSRRPIWTVGASRRRCPMSAPSCRRGG